jgi:hypothetical protein
MASEVSDIVKRSENENKNKEQEQEQRTRGFGNKGKKNKEQGVLGTREKRTKNKGFWEQGN